MPLRSHIIAALLIASACGLRADYDPKSDFERIAADASRVELLELVSCPTGEISYERIAVISDPVRIGVLVAAMQFVPSRIAGDDLGDGKVRVENVEMPGSWRMDFVCRTGSIVEVYVKDCGVLVSDDVRSGTDLVLTKGSREALDRFLEDEIVKKKTANQALQTTPMTRSVYDKIIEFGRSQRGV